MAKPRCQSSRERLDWVLGTRPMKKTQNRHFPHKLVTNSNGELHADTTTTLSRTLMAKFSTFSARKLLRKLSPQKLGKLEIEMSADEENTEVLVCWCEFRAIGWCACQVRTLAVDTACTTPSARTSDPVAIRHGILHTKLRSGAVAHSIFPKINKQTRTQRQKGLCF